MKSLLIKLLCLTSVFALIASACGDDDSAGTQTGGQVTIAEGTTLDLDVCPDDWDSSEGVTDTEIRMGTSLPQSGQLAAFGTIATGMQYYFDYVNATDHIDGKNVVLIAKDDAYEAGRTVANDEEIIETENNVLLPCFGEKLNDERNSYRCSSPRRGESCSIKKQSTRRI